MSDFREWQHHPETIKFRKQVDERIRELEQNMGKGQSISFDNTSFTQGMTGRYTGLIEAFQEVVDEMTPEKKG